MTSNNEWRYFVPAQPDFYELEYIGEDTGGPAVSRTPVVAWQMVPCGPTNDGDPRYRAYPVTIHDDRRWQVDLPIACPDGIVRTAGSADYESEGQWFEDKKKQDYARSA
jgi:hypothetical protein